MKGATKCPPFPLTVWGNEGGTGRRPHARPDCPRPAKPVALTQYRNSSRHCDRMGCHMGSHAMSSDGCCATVAVVGTLGGNPVPARPIDHQRIPNQRFEHVRYWWDGRSTPSGACHVESSSRRAGSARARGGDHPHADYMSSASAWMRAVGRPWALSMRLAVSPCPALTVIVAPSI